MVSFTPRLIPVILPSLAHHVASIREAAHATNFNLYKVVEFLPDPTAPSSPTSPTSIAALPTAAGKQPEAPSSVTILRDRLLSASPTPPTIPFPSLNPATASGISAASRHPSSDRSGLPPKSDSIPNLTSQLEAMSDLTTEDTALDTRVRSHSSQSEQVSNEEDPVDYGATVNAITFQLVSEFEETRIAALEWLLMLHAKAPKKVCHLAKVSVFSTTLTLGCRYWPKITFRRRDLKASTKQALLGSSSCSRAYPILPRKSLNTHFAFSPKSHWLVRMKSISQPS